MTRLLKVEATRLLCRRAVLVLLAAAIVIPMVIGIARVLNTRPPSADEVAATERQIQAETESPWFRKNVARCEEHPRRHGVPAGVDDVQAACLEQMTPTVDQYLWWDRLRLADEREGSGLAVVTVIAILMLLVGTTFAGHDWASGSVSNQLLFEPSRVKVWLAKALVVAAFATAVSGVLMTGYWLVMRWIVGRRGAQPRDGVLLDCLQMGWRGAAVAGGVAVAGFALTMFFRSTVAALGVLLALGLAGGVVLAVIGVDSVWNPGLNLAAVVMDGARYWSEVPCGAGEGGGCSVERTLSLGRGLTFVSALLAACVAASLVTFHRRDVP